MTLDLFGKYNQITHATVNNELTLKESIGEDGQSFGLGLFLKKKNTFDDESYVGKANVTEKEQILLRVPASNTFDIYTILHILLDKKQYSEEKQCQITNNFIKLKMKLLFQELLPSLDAFISTEVIIITFYFILFEFMKKKYELPGILLNYLNDILLRSNINSSIMKPEFTTTAYQHYPVFQLHETFINNLYSIFDQKVLVKTIRQIFACIVSRVLEIPHEIKPNSKNFTVNTTLVPLLDFINHQNPPNCYFDVDRANNNDIVLKLSGSENLFNPDRVDNTTKSVKSQVELFISYTPMEELINMVSTYGFIPKTITQFNVYIDQGWLQDTNYDIWSICNHSEVVMAFQLRKKIDDDSNLNNWQIYDCNIDNLALCFMKEIHTVYRPVNGKMEWSRLKQDEAQAMDAKSKLTRFLIEYLKYRKETLLDILAGETNDQKLSGILLDCIKQEIEVIDSFMQNPSKEKTMPELEPVHFATYNHFSEDDI